MAAIKAAKALVERYWSDRMRKPARPLRDPKTVLQEWAQARGLPTPTYREVERNGSASRSGLQGRRCSCRSVKPRKDKGRSKRAAEQAAAEAMLRARGCDRADV